MAIVKMNKFTLYAFESQKNALLKELQKFEGVQFINSQEALTEEETAILRSAAEDKGVLETEVQLSKIKFSLDFLQKYMEKEGTLKSLREGKKEISYAELEKSMENSNWISIYEDLKAKQEKQSSLNNEITKLEGEIISLTPWLNFDAPFTLLKNSNFTTALIGTIPKEQKENFTKELNEHIENIYIEFINEDKKESYVMVIALKEKENEIFELSKNFGFNKANVESSESPKNIIANSENRITAIKKEGDELVSNLKSYKDKLEELQIAYEYYANTVKRERSYSNFVKSENIIAIQGWSSIESNAHLENAIKKAVNDDYVIEFKEVQEDDAVPIKLKNNKFVEPFESIVEMYSLPNYGEVDPTAIMSVFYVVFFGMMLSDAAYGVMLILGSIMALKFFRLNKGMKNFMKFFLYLGISTLFWGSIYGSWFGDAITSILGIKFEPIINASADIMFILLMAMAMGVVHIFVGLGIKGYMLVKSGKVLDAIYDVLLWYISLIGVFLLIAGIGAPIGKIMTIVGCVGLVLTQGRSAETIGGKIGGGIYGLYGITSYVGDIVSYSRLLALGLATGFIANAFNLMITIIPAGPIRLIFGTILFVVGHLFNFGVNALGAYVHASRLQYLEYFGKFYSGGGKRFSPLKAESKFIDITNK